MAKVEKNKEKDYVVSLWTPEGFLSYPYLTKPDLGREFSDNKKKTDFFIDKATFKLKGKALEDAVREVGVRFHGKTFKLNNPAFHIPFYDTDDTDVKHERMQNCIMLRAKAPGGGTSGKPHANVTMIGPRKGPDGKFPLLSKDEAEAIKGGDWGKLNVLVVPFAGAEKKDKKGNVISKVLPGVSLVLLGFHYWKPGEGFGQGNSQMMQTAEEFEDVPEDVETDADITEVEGEEVDDSDDSVI